MVDEVYDSFKMRAPMGIVDFLQSQQIPDDDEYDGDGSAERDSKNKKSYVLVMALLF